MVYIDSCEKCKNDCESGMTISGLPHQFCGENVIDYFCPTNQGIYTISLKNARKNYGYKGKAFNELDIRDNYGKFQDIVETLSMIGAGSVIIEYSNCYSLDCWRYPGIKEE